MAEAQAMLQLSFWCMWVASKCGAGQAQLPGVMHATLPGLRHGCCAPTLSSWWGLAP